MWVRRDTWYDTVIKRGSDDGSHCGPLVPFCYERVFLSREEFGGRHVLAFQKLTMGQFKIKKYSGDECILNVVPKIS